MRGSRRLATGQRLRSWEMQEMTPQTLCDLVHLEHVRQQGPYMQS